jgi:hypothetical protein
MRLARTLLLPALVLALAAAGATTAAVAKAPASAPPGDASPDPDGGWPREFTTAAGRITVYQPQLDAWDGMKLEARAALAISEPGAESPVFGVGWFEARTSVDKIERMVTLNDYKLIRVAFPSAPGKDEAFAKAIREQVLPKTREISLDRLQAELEVTEAMQKGNAPPLKNDPPRIAFARKPTILIIVDGEPAWRPVKDTKLERVINTRPLVLRTKDGKHFVRVFDGWLQAAALEGPWAVAKKTPGDLKKALKDAQASGQVDLLPGGDPKDPKTLPKLSQGNVPDLLVSTRPTELIVFDGEPNYLPIHDTKLLYVSNTTGNVFKELEDQKIYVLVSGRWFRAPVEKGPWEYVANDALPADFAAIPDDSAKENVKAAVAGTPQAKEALIANHIPQTASVKVSEARMDPPRFDGEPKLVDVEGTDLKYVENTATPIVQVSATSFYAVQNAVWFQAPSLNGPWVVATSVPAVIYTIPTSCPIHYVTYVRIYDTTPEVVQEGYTPGYYGSVVSSSSTVVYGTGYSYNPWVGTTWYGPPMTYGCGVGMTYTPWTGWTFGFGFGWSWGAVTVGWGWGPYPWWGPVGWGAYYPYPYYRPPYWGGAAWGPYGGAAWGPGGWAATTGNVYSRWGSTSAVTRRSGGYNAWTGNAWRSSAGTSYNSRTGRLSAGQRSAVGNVYTGGYAYGSRGTTTNTRTGNTVSAGRGTAGNVRTGGQVSGGYVSGERGTAVRVGDDVYAGRNGDVYRRNPGGGWEQNTGSGWSSVQDSGRTSGLNGQHSARSTGQTRTRNYGATRSGGMRGGGRRR